MRTYYGTVFRRACGDTWSFARSHLLLDGVSVIVGAAVGGWRHPGATWPAAAYPLISLGLMLFAVFLWKLVSVPVTLHQEQASRLQGIPAGPTILTVRPDDQPPWLGLLVHNAGDHLASDVRLRLERIVPAPRWVWQHEVSMPARLWPQDYYRDPAIPEHATCSIPGERDERFALLSLLPKDWDQQPTWLWHAILFTGPRTETDASRYQCAFENGRDYQFDVVVWAENAKPEKKSVLLTWHGNVPKLH